jgi:hypothetical protein
VIRHVRVSFFLATPSTIRVELGWVMVPPQSSLNEIETTISKSPDLKRFYSQQLRDANKRQHVCDAAVCLFVCLTVFMYMIMITKCKINIQESMDRIHGESILA